ncbi:helix-turn-helix protein [Nocardia pseudobrasiliensis]|uniref:Helix-turn-helix protein n=1 Tax=Nocardia pseudobrasiliensis TaxID=45979 RepID=A0A370I0U2_9NOCA|nr:helix-turn-helix protein [Nocardia pseudobrasiliensis]
MGEGNSILARRRLGKHLRDGRWEAGLTLQQTGASIRRSASTVQRLEKGLPAGVPDSVIQALCQIFEFDAVKTAEMLALVAESDTVNWWSEYEDLISRTVATFIAFESAASEITSYEGQLVPGLLQTQAYALTLVQTAYPDESAETHARRLRLRKLRQACLIREDRPVRLNAIIHESIVRSWVGGPQTMAEQCKHLADMSARPNITLRILPFSAGYPLGREDGPFTILDFAADEHGRPTECPLVYFENFTRELYLTDQDAIRKQWESYATLRRNALEPEASREMLRKASEQYDR